MTTAAAAIPRPDASEFAPYYGTYIGKVPEGDVLQMLESQRRDTQRLLAGLSEQQAMHRYAPGKWSIKEVVGHLADSERVFAYRALRFARADETPLASFDEQAWTPAGRFDARSLPDLAAEFDVVRHGTIALFRGLDPETLPRQGIASGKPVSVRALAWIIAGHERHHIALVRERYLK